MYNVVGSVIVSQAKSAARSGRPQIRLWVISGDKKTKLKVKYDSLPDIENLLRALQREPHSVQSVDVMGDVTQISQSIG